MLRRTFLSLPLIAHAQSSPNRYIDTHVHLFSPDTARFPFAPNAPYKPPAALAVEDYVRFARTANVEHAVIVHPEPYQDDHRYLEYAFAHEGSPGFFKGTCLLDPARGDTLRRLKELTARNPGRIVALRIHEVRNPGTPPSATGPIKERDLRSPEMRRTWSAVSDLGLRIQMHMLPHYAPDVAKLAAAFPSMPVILDHLGRGWQGTKEEWKGVLALAKQKQIYLKYAEAPDNSIRALVMEAFEAFGPDRMIAGDLGHDAASFEKFQKLFAEMFGFASYEDRRKILYGTARKLFFS